MKKIVFFLSTIITMNAMQKSGQQEVLLQLLDKVKNSSDTEGERLLDTMIEHGTQLRDAGAVGSNVLHQAVRDECFIFIKKCAQNGADIDVRDDCSRTPLFIACGDWDNYCLHDTMITFLINLGADASKRDKDERTLLHYLARHECNEKTKEIIKLLIIAGADRKHTDTMQKTAFDYALSDDMKRMLLINPCDDHKVLDLQQPPIYALQSNHQLLKQAIPLGLNVNACDPTSGLSLLWLFLNHINYDNYELMEEIIDLFIQHGLAVNYKNQHGNTILHKIVTKENFPPSWAKKIIDAGADVNVRNADSEAPLHWAANCSGVHNLLIAEVLLAHGKADVNAQDSHGSSPLHHALYLSRDSMEQKQKEMVFLLLFYGADFKKKSNAGNTPYDNAMYWRKYDIAQMLKDEESVYKTLCESFWH